MRGAAVGVRSVLPAAKRKRTGGPFAARRFQGDEDGNLSASG